MIFFGKLIGLVAGSFLGIYGAILGLIVGHLLDEILTARKNNMNIRDFFISPFESSLPHNQKEPVAFIGLAVYVLMVFEELSTLYFEKLMFFLKNNGVYTNREAVQLRRLGDHIFKSSDSINAVNLIRFINTSSSPHTKMLLVRSLFFLIQDSPETHARDMAMQKINEITCGMNLEHETLEQIKQEFGIRVPHDYLILGIDPETKIEEIRKVYHTLALQFHPDNATHLSDAQRKASEEAFRRIKTAYERIMKQYRIG